MGKKLLMISFIVVLAAVLPAIYAQKTGGWKQAPKAYAPGNQEAAQSIAQPAGSEPAPPGNTNREANRENEGKAREMAPAPDNPPGTAGRQPKNTDSSGQSISGQNNQEKTPPSDNARTDFQGGPPAGKKPAGGQRPPDQPGEKEVEIAVVGLNGELLYGPQKVTVTEKNFGGVTALGALDATGLPYVTSRRWAIFVEAVAGQRNKGQAGWMYQVNNEIPPAGSDQKPLKEGDRVIWWYSERNDSRPPAWEQLLKQR